MTQKIMQNKENGIDENAKSVSLKYLAREIEKTPPENSTGHLLSSEEMKLASMSLTDDVLTRLSWQMQRLTVRPETQGSNLAIESLDEIKRATAICGTAKAMAQMIKLKIEAVKAFRKINEEGK